MFIGGVASTGAAPHFFARDLPLGVAFNLVLDPGRLPRMATDARRNLTMFKRLFLALSGGTVIQNLRRKQRRIFLRQ
ncbi:hypothetical protein OKW43_000051 [Paraburkholderia sp. WC7.3g]|uniref:hypothetical protein n=1 Tax=Paraburkholderia sp. WC7.3g TaxID=2991070 RepID=UPI003D192B58